MNFMEATHPYAYGTRDCHFNYPGCAYYKEGRCLFDIHPIKLHTERACHQDLINEMIECEADYENGLW